MQSSECYGDLFIISSILAVYTKIYSRNGGDRDCSVVNSSGGYSTDLSLVSSTHGADEDYRLFIKKLFLLAAKFYLVILEYINKTYKNLYSNYNYFFSF